MLLNSHTTNTSFSVSKNYFISVVIFVACIFPEANFVNLTNRKIDFPFMFVYFKKYFYKVLHNYYGFDQIFCKLYKHRNEN